MPTQTSTKAILGLPLTDRLLIERLEQKDAILRVWAADHHAFAGAYYEVVREGDPTRIGARVQSKVVKRLEERGYLIYRANHYELSDAGRTAAKYARDLRAGRRK